MSDPGSVSFVQYLLPALGSANYTVTADQVISVLGQGESPQATQSFFVKGIRHQLDDSGVDSVYPPPGSQGEFGNVLPHVVLTDPTLPWQRSPAAESALQVDVAARHAGAADAEPVPSWLALLLFDELDPPPQPQAKTIADLASQGGVFVPTLQTEHGEKATDPVTVIDVPVSLYARITPSLADLNWLAHTRLAEPAAKATAGDTAPSSEFAVVVGNRLPTAGRTSTAFLVSLEGFGSYLPSEDGVAPSAVPATATVVRFVVLRTWVFSAIQLKQSFQGVLEALHMTPSSLQLLASADAPAAVSAAFGMGYTAMNHRLRNGSRTVSWYRGPLLPLGVRVPPFAQSQASDQLLRYDPGSGMFDVSYAAAWELGRLLALHDRAYATALFRWKLTVAQTAAEQLEEEIVDQLLPPLSSDQVSDASLPPMHRRLARVIRDVVGPAAERIAEPGSIDGPVEPGSIESGGAAWPRKRLGFVDRAALHERIGAMTVLDDPQPGTDQYQVVSWLTRLHLLQGVPFAYLVPDIRMLPAESLRFFQVDNGWLEAIIDGAFSIGATRGTTAAGAVLRTVAVPAARARLHHVRAALVGGAGVADSAADGTGVDGTGVGAPEVITGFLLRSAVVSGWPGMEVGCYADTGAKQPLPLLRLDRVAPDLLICLVGGVLQRVDLREPPEGLHFGVDEPPQKSQTPWIKNLRYASGNDTITVGSWTGGSEPVTLRTGTTTVLRIDDLAQAMKSQVWAPPPPPPPADSQFTAAQFGLEMVEGAQSVTFQVGS